MRVLSFGISQSPVCGMQDYADGLAEELRSRGHHVDRAWRLRHGGQEPVRSWLEDLLRQATAAQTDIILWHYSPFSYGAHGIPTLAVVIAHELRRSRIPVATVLHEMVYPWGREGWRGACWAVAQRAVLPYVVAASSALVLTVDKRARWMNRRPWIPVRPTIVVPAFSNVPEISPPAHHEPAHHEPAHDEEALRVGVFGYQPVAAGLVIDAFVRLRHHRPDAELWLIGAPGADSDVGRTWSRAADRAGAGTAVHFTGVLQGGTLALQLAACDLGVFHDGAGPSSRKGSLAALLHAGLPTVAVDGADTWPELARERPVVLVAAQADQVARALVHLADEPESRSTLAQRARNFYDRHQSRSAVADAYDTFLTAVAAATH
ncbi:MAG TPA: glycosyltransferase family 4 protein [Acidimicrobiales bacterium]|nr:glycosyltransferase family 4 protein [Acidimicrobiales bacterium]